MGVHILAANILGSGLLAVILGVCWWLIKQ